MNVKLVNCPNLDHILVEYLSYYMGKGPFLMLCPSSVNFPSLLLQAQLAQNQIIQVQPPIIYHNSVILFSPFFETKSL